MQDGMQEKVSIMRHLAQMEISVTSGNCFTGTRQSLVPAKTVTLGDGYFDLNLVLMTEIINVLPNLFGQTVEHKHYCNQIRCLCV